MDHRDGGAPVALAGDQPVPDAVGDRALARAALLDVVGDGLHALLAGDAVELAGVDLRARAQVGLLQRLAVPVRRRDDDPNRQAVLRGEREVPLVVGGDAHDRTLRVPGDGVVGHEDGDLLAVGRVHAEAPQRDARLLPVRRQPLDVRLAAGLFDT